MFEMFKGMGQMAEMLRNLPRIREQLEQMQQRQAQITAEGDAGPAWSRPAPTGGWKC